MNDERAYRRLARLLPYIGKDVTIDWRDASDDWNAFRLLAVGVGPKSGKPRVRIIGRNQDGATWIGEPFWVPAADIDTIEEDAHV